MVQKTIISILLSIVSLAIFAQNDYYYYKGQRIPLTINPKKVNVISMTNGPQFAPSMQPNSLPNGLEVESVIANSPYNMCIIKENENVNGLLNNYINATINPNYNIVLPCYYNTEGVELITTNKIYVELKKNSDYLRLQSIISKYHLILVRQNIFMPLWYTISITSQTPYNTIKMANIIFESGIFLSAEPEFRFNAKESISWDPIVGKQWGLYNITNPAVDINISSAWNYATGIGVKVAIVDSGLDYNHRGLRDNVGNLFFDTFTFSQIRCVYEPHGTSVCSTEYAEKTNRLLNAKIKKI